MTFSIITVCMNNLNELKQTSKSLIAQDNSDYEWIIIDGDSSDGTKDWLKENSLSKSWKSEPDNGIYDAMNKGISLSKGKYLIFMNSGDCFNNNKTLTNCQSDIEKHNFPAFIYGDSIDVAENGMEYYRQAKNSNLNWRGMITQHQAMFFNRDKLGDQIYPEEYGLSGDYAFISAFLKQLDNSDILYLNYPFCNFSMGGLNETRRFTALNEDFKIRKEILNLPLYVNLSLYFLHYMHTVTKKVTPSIRFIKHKSTN